MRFSVARKWPVSSRRQKIGYAGMAALYWVPVAALAASAVAAVMSGQYLTGSVMVAVVIAAAALALLVRHNQSTIICGPLMHGGTSAPLVQVAGLSGTSHPRTQDKQ